MKYEPEIFFRLPGSSPLAKIYESEDFRLQWMELNMEEEFTLP